jgi:alpha-N-arabinofuranosidase
VTSAVDELHYVLDPVSTKWGAMRAAYGHPAPYDVKKVEIGNEDFFDPTHSYPTRYAMFYDAIHAAFPSLRFIATTAESSRPYTYLDEHFYEGPSWFPRLLDHHPEAGRAVAR